VIIAVVIGFLICRRRRSRSRRHHQIFLDGADPLIPNEGPGAEQGSFSQHLRVIARISSLTSRTWSNNNRGGQHRSEAMTENPAVSLLDTTTSGGIVPSEPPVSEFHPKPEEQDIAGSSVQRLLENREFGEGLLRLISEHIDHPRRPNSPEKLDT